jgi:hypothetical protein
VKEVFDVDVLSRGDVEELASHQNGWHVTIYMPTHRAGAEIQQDSIRLKNLLRQADYRLIEGGLRAPDAQKLLAPATSLLDKARFWQNQSDGLAVFVVTNRYHVKPLLPLLSGDGRFYVLAISQNQVRLLQGTRYTVDEVDLEGVPTSLEEALRVKDPEREIQFHTGTRGPGDTGEQPTLYHGQGGARDDRKVDILRFCQQVDRGLQAVLRDERAPLVLAAVDYMLPIYRQANTYEFVVDQSIQGNPEELSAQELHGRAWAAVSPRLTQVRGEAIARFQALVGTGQTATALEQILSAAYHGQVDTLFVGLGLEQWGAYDRYSGIVHLHSEAGPGTVDLLDMAAVQTLLNSGTILVLEPDEMPDRVPIAALLRYETMWPHEQVLP